MQNLLAQSLHRSSWRAGYLPNPPGTLLSRPAPTTRKPSVLRSWVTSTWPGPLFAPGAESSQPLWEPCALA